MRKTTIILLISIFGLGTTSCRNAQQVQRNSRFVGEAVQELQQQQQIKISVGQVRRGSQPTFDTLKREQDSAAAVRRTLNSSQFRLDTITNKEKIREAAYEAALSYFESQSHQVSMSQANKIANQAASEKNEELDGAFKNATVTGIASSATTAAYATYQANNPDRDRDRKRY